MRIVEPEEPIRIVLAADTNAAPWLPTVIESITRNQSRPVEVAILTRGWMRENHVEAGLSIRFLDITTLPPIQGRLPLHISPSSFDRILIPSLLPEWNKCFVFDYDQIILSNLAEWWDSMPSDALLSSVCADWGGIQMGAQNWFHEKWPVDAIKGSETWAFCYVGGSLWNLEGMRTQEVEAKALKAIEDWGWNDQIALSYAVENRVQRMPLSWNSLIGMEEAQNPKVLHWPRGGGERPWDSFNVGSREKWLDCFCGWNRFSTQFRLQDIPCIQIHRSEADAHAWRSIPQKTTIHYIAPMPLNRIGNISALRGAIRHLQAPFLVRFPHASPLPATLSGNEDIAFGEAHDWVAVFSAKGRQILADALLTAWQKGTTWSSAVEKRTHGNTQELGTPKGKIPAPVAVLESSAAQSLRLDGMPHSLT